MQVDALRFERIERLSDAAVLDSQWMELWERCPYASVFQSPEWVLGSWRHLGKGYTRALLIGRQREVLVVLIALRLSPQAITLEGSEVSDYLDALIDPRLEPALLESLRASLAAIGRGRPLRFERLMANSPLLALAASTRHWQSSRSEQDVCPYVKLPRPSASLRDAIPHGFRKRLEQSRRAAERQFHVEISAASTFDAGKRLECLFGLHTQRWNQRSEKGVFAELSVRRFHIEVVPRLVARDQIWLLQLGFDGRPVASLLALCGHGRALYYIGGFDLQYAAFSPGRLLIAALFERALASGYTEIDFLRGTERYKYDWGASNRSTHCVTVRALENQECATG